MVGRFGVQMALLAFSGAILAGIAVGNDAQTVLSRALIAMVIAMFIGQLVGWTSKLVLRDHLQRRKVAVDLEHAAAAESSAAEAADEPSETQPA